MSEITKEELMMMIEVQSKSASQLEKIANALNELAEEQKKITEKLSNGITEKVTKCVENKFNEVCSGILLDIKNGVKETQKSTEWLKIILGSATLIILIVSIILNFISGSYELKKDLKEIKSRIVEIGK